MARRSNKNAAKVAETAQTVEPVAQTVEPVAQSSEPVVETLTTTPEASTETTTNVETTPEELTDVAQDGDAKAIIDAMDPKMRAAVAKLLADTPQQRAPYRPRISAEQCKAELETATANLNTLENEKANLTGIIAKAEEDLRQCRAKLSTARDEVRRLKGVWERRTAKGANESTPTASA